MLDALPCWCTKLGTSLCRVHSGLCPTQCTRKKLPQIYWVHLSKKYFVDFLARYLENFRCWKKQVSSWPYLVFYQHKKFWSPFLAASLILLTFLLAWPFSWPLRASFTSDACRDSLVRQEFCGPNKPSSAQAILCRRCPEIVGAIMLLCRTYLI